VGTGEPAGMHGRALKLFGGLAGSYERVVDFTTVYQDRYWKRWVEERLPAGRGGLVLDVGSGTLLMEERLAGSRCEFVGVDLSREMVGVGMSKMLPNVRVVVRGDAEKLPFPDGTFDSVFSCYVPKYVKIDRFAGELARVSRPGAQVVMYDFARPTGLLAPFLGAYTQVGLRVAGFLLGLAGRKAAYTFERLPEIIDGTRWDGEIVRAMEEKDFETLEAKRLTGGAVFAYCGRRGGGTPGDR